MHHMSFQKLKILSLFEFSDRQACCCVIINFLRCLSENLLIICLLTIMDDSSLSTDVSFLQQPTYTLRKWAYSLLIKNEKYKIRNLVASFPIILELKQKNINIYEITGADIKVLSKILLKEHYSDFFWKQIWETNAIFHYTIDKLKENEMNRQLSDTLSAYMKKSDELFVAYLEDTCATPYEFKVFGTYANCRKLAFNDYIFYQQRRQKFLKEKYRRLEGNIMLQPKIYNEFSCSMLDILEKDPQLKRQKLKYDLRASIGDTYKSIGENFQKKKIKLYSNIKKAE